MIDLKENLYNACLDCYNQPVNDKDIKPFNQAYKSIRERLPYSMTWKMVNQVLLKCQYEGMDTNRILLREKKHHAKTGYPENWRAWHGGAEIKKSEETLYEMELKKQGYIGMTYLTWEPYMKMWYAGAKQFDRNFGNYCGRGRMADLWRNEWSKNGIRRWIYSLAKSADELNEMERLLIAKYQADTSPRFHNSRKGGGVNNIGKSHGNHGVSNSSGAVQSSNNYRMKQFWFRYEDGTGYMEIGRKRK